MSEKYEVMVEDGHLVITDEVADLLRRARMLNTTIKSLEDERDGIIKTLKDALISIDATITQERPPATYLLTAF